VERITEKQKRGRAEKKRKKKQKMGGNKCGGLVWNWKRRNGKSYPVEDVKTAEGHGKV